MRHWMRPISSPGRTEKFPPPLMRFLKSNIGNKSSNNRGRRRCRPTPMFFRKKTAVIEPTQEPSSPKVTCIGQVRVRRNPTPRSPEQLPSSSSSSCSCFNFLQRKWFSLFGYCTRGNLKEEISPIEPPPQLSPSLSPPVKTETEPAAISPPKNAFLLTRCRSAPYRSSSLARRFLDDETDDDWNFRNSISSSPESEKKLGTPAEEETVQPLILTRSKSEPGRRLTRR